MAYVQVEQSVQLRALIDAIGRAADLSTVQTAVQTAVRRLTGAEGATFVVRDGDQCFYVDEDAIAPLWKGQRFPLTQCISGWAMLHHAPAVVPDVFADDRIPVAAYEPTFVRSLVMVPVSPTEPIAAIAAIGAYWSIAGRASDASLPVLQLIADAAAAAIARIGLENAPWAPTLSRRDPARAS